MNFVNFLFFAALMCATTSLSYEVSTTNVDKYVLYKTQTNIVNSASILFDTSVISSKLTNLNSSDGKITFLKSGVYRIFSVALTMIDIYPTSVEFSLLGNNFTSPSYHNVQSNGYLSISVDAVQNVNIGDFFTASIDISAISTAVIDGTDQNRGDLTWISIISL